MRGLALGLVVAIAAGCAGRPALEADRAYQARGAAVSRIAVRTHRERSVAVVVSAFGELPDACTNLDCVKQEHSPAGIDVPLLTRRESGARCEPQPTPFETGILLDIGGLAPGLSFVTVNGVQGTFQVFEDLRDPSRLDRYKTW